ncbi:TcaA second domain-containing protein, partial [Bacillus sp. 445_BSPC]|uniref:TcaA second domain-containing protein n=1 Tax=Bacillus sp. 445_BSPC TaxID=1581712 RepID=UPI0006620BA8
MEIVKKNKQRKLTVIIGAVFLLGIITISIIFANRPSSEDLVNEFENAVLTSDTNTLEKLIESPNKDMKVTKEDVEQFISYAKDNNEYTQELVFILHAQRAILEEDNQARLQNPIFENATEGEIKNAGDFYL